MTNYATDTARVSPSSPFDRLSVRTALHPTPLYPDRLGVTRAFAFLGDFLHFGVARAGTGSGCVPASAAIFPAAVPSFFATLTNIASFGVLFLAIDALTVREPNIAIL